MKYVYLLRSRTFPHKRYVGITDHLDKRLSAHNAGQCSYTAGFRPWKVVVAIRFEDNARAEEFERYLKSGSGNAFARRRLW
jgi:putative endonuclease